MISAYLQELLGDRATVLAFGTPGETLHEASVYRSSALDANADYVLLQFGTNDASPSLFRADAFRASAETLLDTHIEALGAEHVAFLLPPCIYPAGGDIASFGMSNDTLAEVRAILTEVCAEKGVAVVDLYSVTCDHPEWFPDGVHPNADGNRAIAEAICEALFAQ
jgi:lysophospholipase L1-like esterase